MHPNDELRIDMLITWYAGLIKVNTRRNHDRVFLLPSKVYDRRLPPTDLPSEWREKIREIFADVRKLRKDFFGSSVADPYGTTEIDDFERAVLGSESLDKGAGGIPVSQFKVRNLRVA